MAQQLTSLGTARVLRDPRTGELVVDTDSLRRTGASDIGGEYDDDFGDDEDYDDEGDFEGDDVPDNDLEVMDFGASRRRNHKRSDRKSGGKKRPATSPKPRKEASEETWGMTAVSGTDTLSDGGSASVRIRLQHDFRAQDITFEGSAQGAKVTSIFFGDRAVWSNPAGIPVSVFGSSSFMRGLLKGQALKAGLDIVVNGSLTGNGDFAVTIIGAKPVGAGR